MLLEDTLHARVDDAPLINGAMGITIRGAGLMRAHGGMYGFWRRFKDHYRQQGGVLRVACPVQSVSMNEDGFCVHTRHGEVAARQVVSTLPASLTRRLAPAAVARALAPFLERGSSHSGTSEGGAVVVFLGVPEEEVGGHVFTHHQLLHDYRQPLGNGNNLFISVSAAGDTESAPDGHRSVMISTHCKSKHAIAARNAHKAALLPVITRMHVEGATTQAIADHTGVCLARHSRPEGTRPAQADPG
jgi:phytoene dehydrogenase-like protein